MSGEEIKDSAPLTERSITVLLVDDQAFVGEAVRRMLAEEQDIRFHFCSDPSKAIQTAREVGPTVILQDLVMPEIDGLTLVRFYRADAALKDVPLIVLSTKEEATTKAEAFALGANDYLVKLPDRIELIARIRYHSRGYIALLERNEVMRRLVAELSEAAQYVTNLLPAPLTAGPIRTSWRFVPSTSLGGDSLGYHWLDDGHFAFFLLDVCGHGVGAALLSVSVMNVLRAQTLPNVDFREPDQVLNALNESFQMERHNGMYFTMWYGVYRTADRTITYSSGGHPAALVITDDTGKPPVKLITPNFIVGALPNRTFRRAEQVLAGPTTLYLFSDGVYEVTKPDGEMWDYTSFADHLAAPIGAGSRIDRLYDYVRAMCQDEALPDDFTILELTFE
jgi:sigma-B regulation protein RsbU (phosphoserine phosphatase)